MKSQGKLQVATAVFWQSASQWAFLLLLLLSGWSSVLVWQERSLAAEPQPEPQPTVSPANNPLPSEPPLDLKALRPGQIPPGVVTSSTISPTHLTIPSLWWVQEQIVANTQDLNEQLGKELIVDWLAYPVEQGAPGRVDLVVDRQFWGVLDYLQRYEFVNRFSTIARNYGSNIRVFDNQATIVAAFTCNFSKADLRLLQLSMELSGIPLLKSETGYSRSPIADQLSCTVAIETGISSFFRRNPMIGK